MKCYLIRYHDYEASIPVAVYTSRRAARADIESRGENFGLDEIELDPESPPLLRWWIWEDWGDWWAELTLDTCQKAGVHCDSGGNYYAIVRALNEEEAIEKGKELLREYT